jgi:hypothetical protein
MSLTQAVNGNNIVFSDHQLPEDGDGASPRNVVCKAVNAGESPRRLY